MLLALSLQIAFKPCANTKRRGLGLEWIRHKVHSALAGKCMRVKRTLVAINNTWPAGELLLVLTMAVGARCIKGTEAFVGSLRGL